MFVQVRLISFDYTVHRSLDKLTEIDSIIPGNYILISHNSDFYPRPVVAKGIVRLPKLVHWYGLNIGSSARQTTIPIGLENLQWKTMYPEMYARVAALKVTKTQEYIASANFRLRKSRERRALLPKLKSLDWVDSTEWGSAHSTDDPTISKHEAWLRKQAGEMI